LGMGLDYEPLRHKADKIAAADTNGRAAGSRRAGAGLVLQPRPALAVAAPQLSRLATGNPRWLMRARFP